MRTSCGTVETWKDVAAYVDARIPSSHDPRIKDLGVTRRVGVRSNGSLLPCYTNAGRRLGGCEE